LKISQELEMMIVVLKISLAENAVTEAIGDRKLLITYTPFT
jgi:hypothetical protein